MSTISNQWPQMPRHNIPESLGMNDHQPLPGEGIELQGDPELSSRLSNQAFAQFGAAAEPSGQLATDLMSTAEDALSDFGIRSEQEDPGIQSPSHVNLGVQQLSIANAHADNAGVDRIMNTMQLADTDSILFMANATLRDLQSTGHQAGIAVEQNTVEAAQEARTEQLRQAEEAQNKSDFWGKFADVLGKVVAVVAATVSAAASCVTGGLGLVAAAGILLAVFGPMTCQALGDAGVLPKDVAMGIGLGCAVVGSALSLGAGLAAGAASTATAVANTVQNVNTIAQAGAQVGVASAQIGAAAEGKTATDRTIDATGSGMRAENAQGQSEEEMGLMRDLFDMFRRCAEVLGQIREARSEGMQHAIRA